MKAKVIELSKAQRLVWLTAGKNEELEGLKGDVTLIPLKSYIEKDGTFVNHAGLHQKVTRGLTIVPNALSIIEVVEAFAGQDVKPEEAHDKVGQGRVHNEATAQRGAL
jgi:NADH-quinone oxidoreductase subunit G